MGISYLYPLGDYEGGDMILWEYQIIMILYPGDLFFFRDHEIIHSNIEVIGIRYSVIVSI
jgi:hypothetical protein